MKMIDLLPDAAKKAEKPQKLVLERLQRLADYDLSFLTSEFTADKVRTFSPEQLFPLIKHFGKYKMVVDKSVADRLELEFKRFVAIALLRPSRRNAPSGPVDMYWHFFVLHTGQYVGFCTAIFGMFGPGKGAGTHYPTLVDHVPATDETRPMMNDAYRETRKIYAELYGDPDERFWPQPPSAKSGIEHETTCGDSYSGFVHPIFQVKQGTSESISSKEA